MSGYCAMCGQRKVALGVTVSTEVLACLHLTSADGNSSSALALGTQYCKRDVSSLQDIWQKCLFKNRS